MILTLSEKLYGEVIYHHGLPLVRDKIERQYRAKDPRKPRVGFIDGLSPYLLRLEDRHTSCVRISSEASLDARKRTLRWEGGEIEYEWLVWVGPLTEMVKVLYPERAITLLGGGARFVVYATNESRSVNRMWYDCSPQSRIYRVFAPLAGILVVQVAISAAWDSVEDLGAEVGAFLHLGEAPQYVLERDVQVCYPLDRGSPQLYGDLQCLMSQLSIIGFGRMGQWEYKDLHELPWEMLDERLKHLK